MIKEKTKSILAIVITLGAISTIFYEPTELGAEIVRAIFFAIVGYYFNSASRREFVNSIKSFGKIK